MEQYVGSIDAGTSSVRFILFNRQGEIVASHSIEVELKTPNDGWVEQDPVEYLQKIDECIRAVLEKGYTKEQIVAVGITNQRETTIAWDKTTGTPLYQAIIWSDVRTEDDVEEMIQSKADDGGKDAFRSKCGLPISTYFSAMKMRWLLKNVDAVAAKAQDGTLCMGTVDTWLIWNLLGGLYITDVTNASRTMLMNITSLTWDEDMCNAMNIPISVLAEIRSNSERYGTFPAGHVLEGVPLSGCLGDQQAASLGQLITDIGMVKNTYGTGAFMLMNTGTGSKGCVPSQNGCLTTVLWNLNQTVTLDTTSFALEGAVAVAGQAIKFLRDNLGMIDSASEASQLAGEEKDNGDVYFVPAFGGLFAPYWRPEARGTIVGMTLKTNKRHICRAAIEAACYRTMEVIRAMCEDSGVDPNGIILHVDGGMSASDVMLQFQADILQGRVFRPSMIETTAFGSAIAAGLAVGFWSGLDDVKNASKGSIDGGSNFVPNMSEEEARSKMGRWEQAVQRALGWHSHL